jgi:hypothetical protein
MDEKTFRIFIAGCILILLGILGWAVHQNFKQQKSGIFIEGPGFRVESESHRKF